MKYSTRTLLAVWVAAMAAFLAVPEFAAAENPVDVQADLANDGIYVARSRSDEVDRDVMLSVIERARSEGVRMQIAWPDDPRPNTGAFARRVQEFNDVDAVLVFGPDGELGGFVSEDYEDDSVRAINAARAAVGFENQADAYLTGLLEEPVRERPAIISTLVRWIALLLGALVVGAVGEQMIRQYRRSRQRRQLEELQSTLPPSSD